MDFHHFIYDINQIETFAKTFSLKEEHLAVILYLSARRKYYPTLKKPFEIIKKDIIAGSSFFEETFKRHVIRLQCPVEGYVLDISPFEKTPIKMTINPPTEAFAIYVLVNPRNTFKSLVKTMDRCVESISNNQPLPKANYFYIEDTVNCIAEKKWKQIDLDSKEKEKVLRVLDLLDLHEIKIIISIETKNGFHIVISSNLSKEASKDFWALKQESKSFKLNVNNEKVEDYWFSISNDCCVILPGTFQGGFKTKIVNLFELYQFKQLHLDLQ